MLRLDKIAGFDFEKKSVLIRTSRTFFNNECKRFDKVYVVEPISDDEIQAMWDAFMKQRSINEEYKPMNL